MARFFRGKEKKTIPHLLSGITNNFLQQSRWKQLAIVGGAVGAVTTIATIKHDEPAYAADLPKANASQNSVKISTPSTSSSGSENNSTITAVRSFGLLSIASGLLIGGSLFLASIYKRCPANKILVVQGAFTQGGAKCSHGGGSFVIPVFQEHSYLDLEPMQIEAPLKGTLSLENIRVNVPSVFTVAISTEAKLMQNAAQRLLGLNRDQISHQARDIIFGQMRQIVASMKIQDINRSREEFVGQVRTNIEHELEKIGLVLINVNITDLTDDAGYLVALGKKATQEAIQKAEVDVATAEKWGQISVTELRKDMTLQKALLLKDQTIGEASAKFTQESEVKAQERDMRIKVATVNADAIRGENETRESIAVSNSKLAIRQAEAHRESETKVKEAEAAIREAEARAEARAALEVASRIEAEKRAELEAPAKAEKAKMIVDAEAEGEKARIAARANAEARFAQLEAEARGQLEILKSKAMGMKLIVDAAGGSKEAFQLLMLEHVDKLAETASKAIANIKFDKVVVWDGGNAQGGNAAANFVKGMANALPPTMQIMKDIGGVELPKYLGTFADDMGTDLVTKKENLNRIAVLEKLARESGDESKAEEYKQQKLQLLEEIEQGIREFKGK